MGHDTCWNHEATLVCYVLTDFRQPDAHHRCKPRYIRHGDFKRVYCHSHSRRRGQKRIVSIIVSYIDVPCSNFEDHSYFQMISTAKSGGTITTYSSRFTLTGMTGTTSQALITAATAAGDTVPATVDAVANDVAADAAAGAVNMNSGVPYASQTGLFRWAPMQSVPPTKITKKDTKPLYPTSSYKIATAFLPTPSPTKTETGKQTFSADSMENTVSPIANTVLLSYTDHLNRLRPFLALLAMRRDS
jgi:hypothetical protein